MTIDELGRAIRAARETMGLSQAGAGSRAGIGGHVVYNIEKGRQFPCWERLEVLCKALKIDAGQFKEMYKDKDFGGRKMLTRTEFMDNGADTSEKRGRKPEAGTGQAARAEQAKEGKQMVTLAETLKEVYKERTKAKKPAAKKQQPLTLTPTAPLVRSMPRTIVQTVTPDSDLIIHVGGYRITINKI